MFRLDRATGVRLTAIIAAFAAVMAGSVAAMAAVGNGVVHSGASATIPPLAPLDVQAINGSTVYAADGTTVLAVLKSSQTRIPVQLDQAHCLDGKRVHPIRQPERPHPIFEL